MDWSLGVGKKVLQSKVLMPRKTHGWLLASGLGVGWLIGVSVSPVLSIVVTGLIGALAGLSGVLAGIDGASRTTSLGSRNYRDPVPLAVLIVGITIGSVVGVAARTHAWLSPSVNDLIDKWTAPSIALDRKEVARRLFDELYPPPQTASIGERNPTVALSQPSANASVLYAASADECARFLTKDGEDLRIDLKTSVTSIPAREFAGRVGDPTALKEAVSLFICPKH